MLSDRCQFFDNLINLVKNLNSQYIKQGNNVVSSKLNSLNMNCDQEQQCHLENQKKEAERVFKHMRNKILEMYEEIGIVTNFYCSEEEMHNLKDKDKCFEQQGNGIQFYCYDSRILVSLYRIKDGVKERNRQHSQLEKRLEPQYFIDYLNKQINLSQLFQKIKKFYFYGIRKMQKQFVPCILCSQILKYYDGYFVSPSLFYLNKKMKIMHQSCFIESRQSQKKSYDL